MIKTIVKDIEQLQTRCKTANIKEDFHIIQDLIDTANESNKPVEDEENQRGCCGLTANQIGYDKRIVIIQNGDQWLPLINPMIIYKSKEQHESKEGCMSLEGERTIQRHDNITVKFQVLNGKFVKVDCGGFIATVIQHEVDHLNGMLI